MSFRAFSYYAGRRYSYKRWAFGRRWRNTADSATLAHAIHKRRMRQRAMRIFGGMTDIKIGGPLLGVTGIESGLITDAGQRAFPELDSPLGIIGKFIGELIHTYNATWEWTGNIWRQKF